MTTLSYLIALVAARERPGPVLVADTGGPNADLAALAGVEVPRTLGALAEQLAAGVPLGAGVYATGESGLRVLASGPEFSSPAVDADVRGLLGDAREAHTLTVIDCGTLTRTAQQTTAAAATHVAWVLTATRQGVERGQRVLEAAPSPPGKELIVARGDGDQPTVPLRQLRQIAADRSTPVVLMPHLTELEQRQGRGLPRCGPGARASRPRRG